MPDDLRFDVVLRRDRATVEPHYCRDWDCHGSDPEHGHSLADACAAVAAWHRQQAELWETMQHPDALLYATRPDSGEPRDA